MSLKFFSAVTFLLISGAFPINAATIRGKVIEDNSGSPVLSAGVRIYKIGTRGLAADLETNGQGRFEVTELPDGQYRIELSKPNYLQASLLLELTPAEPVVTAFVRLVRTGVITGRVTDQAGNPVTGATAFALLKPSGQKPLQPVLESGRYVTVDPSGNYRLHGLPPGQYFVAVSFGSSTIAMGTAGMPSTRSAFGSGFLLHGGNASPEALTIKGGEEHSNIDFTVSPGSLFSVSGKLELPAPLARFWLALASVDQPGFAVAVTTAEKDGSFRFEGVAPGSYHLFASGPTNARGGRGAILDPEPFFARTLIEVLAANLTGLSLTPAKGQSVSFRLQPSSPELPCPDSAQLEISPLEDWGASLERHSAISSSKEANVPNLAPGRYTADVIGLNDECFVPSETIFDLRQPLSGGITIRAVPAGSIRGRLDAPGQRPADFSIILISSGPAASAESLRVAVPDANSRFNFGRLRPGRYRIVARRSSEIEETRSSSQAVNMFEIEVPPGSPLDLDLAVPASDPPRPR